MTEWFFWRHYWRQAHPIWFRIKAHLTGFCLTKREIPWHKTGGPALCWLKLKAVQYKHIFLVGWLVELKINLIASEPNSAKPYPQGCPQCHQDGWQGAEVCCKGLSVSSGGEVIKWHPFAVFSMQTCGHLGLCREQGPSPAGACTARAEDKHHVLVARVFTLLSDVLLDQFDCTNNKWASKNVVLKAFEAQGWEVMCTPKLAQQWWTTEFTGSTFAD